MSDSAPVSQEARECLYQSIKLVPYEERFFRTVGMAESLGYTVEKVWVEETALTSAQARIAELEQERDELKSGYQRARDAWEKAEQLLKDAEGYVYRLEAKR